MDGSFGSFGSDGDTDGGVPVAVTVLPRLTEDQIFAHRRFFVPERTLGEDEDAEVHWQPVGGVSFGYVDPSLPRPEELPASLFRRVLAQTSRHLIVLIPFDLDELPGRQSYERASVRVRLDADYAQALRLDPGREIIRVSPDHDDADEPLDPEELLNPEDLLDPEEQWKREFTGLAARLGEYTVARGGRLATAEESRPIVTPFGEGHQTFGWTFQGQPGHPLWHRSIVTAALVELSAEATELAGELRAQASVRRRRLGQIQVAPAPAREQVRFRIPLPAHTSYLPPSGPS